MTDIVADWLAMFIIVVLGLGVLVGCVAVVTVCWMASPVVGTVAAVAFFGGIVATLYVVDAYR